MWIKDDKINRPVKRKLSKFEKEYVAKACFKGKKYGMIPRRDIDESPTKELG